MWMSCLLSEMWMSCLLSLWVEIADNGRSFPVKETLLARSNKRLGLVGMRERIEMIGGTLTIESIPGQGTTVRAEVPFTPPETLP